MICFTDRLSLCGMYLHVVMFQKRHRTRRFTYQGQSCFH